MVSVLDEYTTEEQRSFMHLLWANINVKDINKEMFPAYGGKCLSHIMFHNWVENFSQGLSKDADDIRPGAEVGDNSQKTSIPQILLQW
jgi:hypothetical protein